MHRLTQTLPVVMAVDMMLKGLKRRSSSCLWPEAFMISPSRISSKDERRLWTPSDSRRASGAAGVVFSCSILLPM